MSVVSADPTRGRGGLWRWAVALVATLALVLSGSGLVVFAQSGQGESQGPVFVPADMPIYLEARLDMPAGQDEMLAQMLTAFPLFADAGSFDMKLDEALASLTVGGLEIGALPPDTDLVGDVLTGEIGLAIGDLGAVMSGAGDPPMLIGMAVADADLATSMLTAMAGSAATEEMVNDTAVLSDGSTSGAVHGDWMLVSNDPEMVKAGIDVLDGNAPSLAADPDFSTAFARVPAAHLGAAYMDLQSFGSLIDMAGMMADGQTGMDLPVGDLAALLPVDMVMYLAAEADRLNLEAIVTPAEGTMDLPLGESDLANLFPSDTQLYVEAREMGTTVETTLNGLVELLATQAEAMPGESLGGMSDLDMLFGEDSPVTSMLGVPLPQFLDFVVDASVGAGLSSDGLWLGMAGEVSDETVAQERVDSIISLLRLFGGDPAETGISVETEMVGDVEVTNIMLPLDQMLAGSGLPIALGDSISIAVADGNLLLGLGDFVQSALAADGGDSLGTSAGYVDALAGDTTNSGVMYVNISSLLGALDPMLSMMIPEWADIAPYATGLDRMIAVGTADDEVMRARMTVIANQ